MLPCKIVPQCFRHFPEYVYWGIRSKLQVKNSSSDTLTGIIQRKVLKIMYICILMVIKKWSIESDKFKINCSVVKHNLNCTKKYDEWNMTENGVLSYYHIFFFLITLISYETRTCKFLSNIYLHLCVQFKGSNSV